MKGMNAVIGTLMGIGITVVIWLLANQFAKAFSDYQVIQPREGISCIVVSRMFNTSVDCWKENE